MPDIGEAVVNDDAVVCWKFTATVGSILHNEVSFARVRTEASPSRQGGNDSQDIRCNKVLFLSLSAMVKPGSGQYFRSMNISSMTMEVLK